MCIHEVSFNHKGFIGYDTNSKNLDVSRNAVFFENQIFFPHHVSTPIEVVSLPSFEDTICIGRLKSGFVYKQRPTMVTLLNHYLRNNTRLVFKVWLHLIFMTGSQTTLCIFMLSIHLVVFPYIKVS